MPLVSEKNDALISQDFWLAAKDLSCHLPVYVSIIFFMIALTPSRRMFPLYPAVEIFKQVFFKTLLKISSAYAMI